MYPRTSVPVPYWTPSYGSTYLYVNVGIKTNTAQESLKKAREK